MTRYRMNPACTFLIRAFAPGCPTMLRCWTHKRVGMDGGPTQANRGRAERVTLNFNLPDGKARLRAEELVRSAGTLRQIRIGRRVVRDLEASVVDDRLVVDALLVTHVVPVGGPIQTNRGPQ